MSEPFQTGTTPCWEKVERVRLRSRLLCLHGDREVRDELHIVVCWQPHETRQHSSLFLRETISHGTDYGGNGLNGCKQQLARHTIRWAGSRKNIQAYLRGNFELRPQLQISMAWFWIQNSNMECTRAQGVERDQLGPTPDLRGLFAWQGALKAPQS